MSKEWEQRGRRDGRSKTRKEKAGGRSKKEAKQKEGTHGQAPGEAQGEEEYLKGKQTSLRSSSGPSLTQCALLLEPG